MNYTYLLYLAISLKHSLTVFNQVSFANAEHCREYTCIIATCFADIIATYSAGIIATYSAGLEVVTLWRL